MDGWYCDVEYSIRTITGPQGRPRFPSSTIRDKMITKSLITLAVQRIGPLWRGLWIHRLIGGSSNRVPLRCPSGARSMLLWNPRWSFCIGGGLGLLALWRRWKRKSAKDRLTTLSRRFGGWSRGRHHGGRPTDTPKLQTLAWVEIRVQGETKVLTKAELWQGPETQWGPGGRHASIVRLFWHAC